MTRDQATSSARYEAGLEFDEPWWHDGDSAWSAGFEYGAAVAFGLMGMAEAIREGQWGEIDRCVECWCPNLLHFSFCSKHRDNREQRT